jgi:transposase InsO family protein
MPWKESSPMSQRVAFIARYLQHDTTMTELCDEFGVSRQTGYKWVDRWNASGTTGLTERSRARRTHPNAYPTRVRERLLEERAAHPSWGPLKLLARLATVEPDVDWPCPSAVAVWLHEAGVTAPRRQVRRVKRTTTSSSGPVGTQDEPNETWATDFKGEFVLGNGRACFPLTLQDGCSRFLLACAGLCDTRTESVIPVYERAFREYGLPKRMRSDNGSPFASASLTGLTRLSVWWIKLGIEPDLTDPGNPQQNGRLERFHRTLLETVEPRAEGHDDQQGRFDGFRVEFNDIRPHASLGQKPPASVYMPSPRPFPPRLPAPEYEDHWEVRKIAPVGTVRVGRFRPSISRALAGEQVALEPIGDGRWNVRFHAHVVATFDGRAGTLSSGTKIRKCSPSETGRA